MLYSLLIQDASCGLKKGGEVVFEPLYIIHSIIAYVVYMYPCRKVPRCPHTVCIYIYIYMCVCVYVAQASLRSI